MAAELTDGLGYLYLFFVYHQPVILQLSGNVSVGNRAVQLLFGADLGFQGNLPAVQLVRQVS